MSAWVLPMKPPRQLRIQGLVFGGYGLLHQHGRSGVQVVHRPPPTCTALVLQDGPPLWFRRETVQAHFRDRGAGPALASWSWVLHLVDDALAGIR